MRIQCDTREHKKELERIQRQFDRLGVEYFNAKLSVGDYMSTERLGVSIDRKKNLLELCGNITQQHKRFQAELVRAQKQGIKLIILVEHGEDIKRLSDVYFWHNPRLDKYEWVIEDGKPVKKQLYPRATTGEQLYKSLCTMIEKYGVEIRFCNKKETGYEIARLLSDGK
jgi:hypothetical protein